MSEFERDASHPAPRHDPPAGAPAGHDRPAGQPRGQGQYGGYGYTYGYEGYGTSDEDEVNVMDLVRALYRRRWTALTVFGLVFVAVAVNTFTTTPVFQARAQLLIEPENPNIVSFQEVVKQESATNEYYQTQFSILKSRALARRTLTALNAWTDPFFGGGPQTERSFSVVGAISGAIGRVLGLFSTSDHDGAAVPGPGESPLQSRMVDGFLGNLSVSPIRNSRLVNVEYLSTRPDVAATVVNTLAKQYIEQNLEYKFLSTKEASDWLGKQLADQRKKLEESEQALQRYREQGDAVALEDRQNIVVQRLADLNSAVTRARTMRIEKEALYQQLSTLQGDRRSLDTFPAILSNTFIQQLKSQLADLQRQQVQMAERLGEKHPDMIKVASEIQSTQVRLDAEINKVVQSVRNEFLAAQSQERSLASDLERQKGEALALNRTGIQYSVLSREAESNKQIYDALMQRAKETGISGELKTSNIRVVDYAEVPARPVKPNKATNLLFGLLGGLVAGIGLALVIEYLDTRIKNPDEIRHILGLPFLGLVPGLSVAQSRMNVPSAHSVAPRDFVEAFRSIRTNLMCLPGDAKSRALVVTSSQPGEGKTVVASNIAMSLAQTGQRVLLVDADMRKPRQHAIFKMNHDPGLSTLLSGQAKAADTVKKAPLNGLWVLPAGAHPTDPAELLGSQRFKDMLTSLADQFDWVILDSPPVLAVTDAAVIGRLTHGVVFVVGSEQVNRQTALRAIEQLATARATIVGAVLNRVNVDKDPYYYSHYYRADYSRYYADDGSPRA